MPAILPVIIEFNLIVVDVACPEGAVIGMSLDPSAMASLSIDPSLAVGVGIFESVKNGKCFEAVCLIVVVEEVVVGSVRVMDGLWVVVGTVVVMGDVRVTYDMGMMCNEGKMGIDFDSLVVGVEGDVCFDEDSVYFVCLYLNKKKGYFVGVFVCLSSGD